VKQLPKNHYHKKRVVSGPEARWNAGGKGVKLTAKGRWLGFTRNVRRYGEKGGNLAGNCTC